MATTVSTIPSSIPAEWTLADILEHLGGVPPSRIRAYPFPGTATEKDVLEAESRFGRICELVDGVLVQKTMGYYESMVAVTIIHLLKGFLEKHDLGIVLGDAGTLRVLPSQVRIPDVCFISWDKFPSRQLPREPIPAIAPDLAIEVISEGNTEREMERKLRDYFTAGVRLVWYLDPRTRTAKAFTSLDQCTDVGPNGSLDGGDVLPGFALPLQGIFPQAPGQPNA